MGATYQRAGNGQTRNEVVEHLIIQQLKERVAKLDVVQTYRQSFLIEPSLVHGNFVFLRFVFERLLLYSVEERARCRVRASYSPGNLFSPVSHYNGF